MSMRDEQKRGEVRLVACRLNFAGDPVPIGYPSDAWEYAITEEEADRAMHVSGSYTDERKKVRAAFSDTKETGE